ncbi:histone-lysine N-methyltransferase MECOM-like [Belonocnema kinseyi]|uniref:histone-lysine N-methyltransferase MECOM-like n=1 Tax=Belonocnema kinseyi TaxID=2817044 RepID=UPI00143DFE9A|nr:histone-lysine N-methyltransferase MECOM-like [Belonocnema kinseyi]
MNYKGDAKTSTERPDSGPFSALHPGHFLEFETVFWTPESDEPNLLCVGNQSTEKYITADIKEELIQDQETANMRQPNMFAGQNRLQTRTRTQRIVESKPENKYKCEKCGRSYTQEGNLGRHLKFECGVTPQFRCNFCDRRFKRNAHLQRHVAQVHQKTKKQKAYYFATC